MDRNTMYRAVTRNVEVTVTPRFVTERSSPEHGYFFWAYTIEITNLGSGTIQPTPSGFMVGTYGMVSESGENFDIDIPAFSLDCSYAERTIN
jgi:ApaG protein